MKMRSYSASAKEIEIHPKTAPTLLVGLAEKREEEIAL